MGRHWQSFSAERNFDLWLAGLDKPESASADRALADPGDKFSCLARLLERSENDLCRYKFVFLPDPDVIIGPDAIERLFTVMEKENLAAAQPALSPDGRIAHEIVKVMPQYSLRRVNFVQTEVMALRMDFLLQQWRSLAEVPRPSLEWIIPQAAANGKGGAAIVDAAVCKVPFTEITPERKKKMEHERQRAGEYLDQRGVKRAFHLYEPVHAQPGRSISSTSLFKINLRYEWLLKKKSPHPFWRTAARVRAYGREIPPAGAYLKGMKSQTAQALRPRGSGRRGRDAVLFVVDAELWPPSHGFTRRLHDMVAALRESGFWTAAVARMSESNSANHGRLLEVFDEVKLVASPHFCWDSVERYSPERYFGAVGRMTAELDPLAVIAVYVWMAPCLDAVRNGALKLIDSNDLMHRRNDYFFQEAPLCTREEEKSRFEKADAIIAIQSLEARMISEMVPAKRVVVAGHHAPARQAPPSSGKRIIIVGSDNSCNIHGLSCFMDRAWPVIRRIEPEARLEVYGNLSDHCPLTPGVTAHGFVDDLIEAYDGAAVVAAPLLLGTGLKIKSVEALCHGKALVTTSIGAEGIEEGAGRAFIIEDDLEKMGERLAGLLSDHETRRRLEREAHIFAKSTFSREKVYGPLIDIIRETKAARS